MKKIKHLPYIGLVLLAALQALPTLASEVNGAVETNQAKLDKSTSAQITPGLDTETVPRFLPRFGVNYTTEGAGFDNFGSFEAFIPVLQSPGKNLTFLEGKLLWTTSNGALGGNLLLGHRF